MELSIPAGPSRPGDIGEGSGSAFGIRIPRTAFLGAVILTGYLGGAVATQVRLEDPWFLFPVGFGVLTWGALMLRDPRLRPLLP